MDNPETMGTQDKERRQTKQPHKTKTMNNMDPTILQEILCIKKNMLLLLIIFCFILHIIFLIINANVLWVIINANVLWVIFSAISRR